MPSILLVGHCVVIVLGRHLLGSPLHNAKYRPNSAPSPAASQRVVQERLWKAAGVTAGPIAALIVVGWVSVVSRPFAIASPGHPVLNPLFNLQNQEHIDLPSQSDLLIQLIITALLFTSILIVSPTASRFSRS